MRQDVQFLALLDYQTCEKINFIIETIKLFHGKLNGRNVRTRNLFWQ